MKRAALLLAALLVAGNAAAEEPPRASQSSARGTTPAQEYCINIADDAADARAAWQAKTLKELEKELDARIAALEAKRAEYESWLARREAFLEKAENGLVEIYSKMKPDAAAQQLALLDEETAAAIIMKLNARSASTILNEMDPSRAAKLTKTWSQAAERPETEDGT
jgi:flagellar motility protein MotE (MotC chaperone)